MLLENHHQTITKKSVENVSHPSYLQYQGHQTNKSQEIDSKEIRLQKEKKTFTDHFRKLNDSDQKFCKNFGTSHFGDENFLDG